MRAVGRLWLVLAVLLAACGGPRKHVPAPRQESGQRELTQEKRQENAYLSPIMRRILALARSEWHYFGSQTVVYREDEESIPHVGIWEDDDESHVLRVNGYWRAVGKPGLSGSDCQQPWSAAFISWVMKTAGVPEMLFPSASAHWVYLSKIIRDTDGPYTAFVPRSIHDYSPRPGDLICANREHYSLPSITQPLDSYLLENAKLHCDIVVERNGSVLEAIGGNVRNSVSKSILTLDAEGHLRPTRQRPWFLVLENRL
ncbi:MAG TPA: DUF2272 domain-containing protein [Methylococcus sp.]|nr:DUF2272 domain-containing protein [Methylococcus sp.]